jgi:hypothetical protein
MEVIVNSNPALSASALALTHTLFVEQLEHILNHPAPWANTGSN